MEDKELDQVKFAAEVILEGKNFQKEYKAKDLTVLVRTRSGDELQQLISKMSDAQNPTVLTFVVNMHNLAYGLVKVNDTNYDKGTLEERLKIISSMPAPKINILVNILSKFDAYVEELRKEYDNF